VFIRNFDAKYLDNLGVRVNREPTEKCLRQLMTSSMKSHDYDIILVTSQYSKSSDSEIKTRINCACGPYMHTL